MKINYDLMRIAQMNSAQNRREMCKRNNRAEGFLARNKKKNTENPSDFQLILAGLSVPLSIMAAYFVCCLF